MSLSRKRKKELRRLHDSANRLWESQNVLVGEAAGIVREARRQLGNYSREQVVPEIHSAYSTRVVPVVDRGVQLGRNLAVTKVVPVVGSVVGSALSVWDELKSVGLRADAYSKQTSLALAKRLVAAPPAPVKSGIGVGGVVAIVLGVVAAAGVLYATWQTLRADDELWVADDPLRSPDE